MARIDIWQGTASFSAGMTPFGYYDDDVKFQTDAVRVAKYIGFQLGFPVLDVELNQIQMFTALENAVNTYALEIYNYKIRDNYSSFEGNKISTVNVNSQVVTPSLNNIIRISQAYGTLAGVGGKVPFYSGSIDLVAGKSVYDLKEWALASASIEVGDSIEVRKIYHYPTPASIRFYDPLGGTGLGVTNLLDGFGFGEYSPSINYTLLPLSLDVLRIQTLELNDQIRRSQYSFELRDNVLKISPIPQINTKLWFDYTKESETNSSFSQLPSGSSGSVIISGSEAIITNPSQVPYSNLVYSDINHSGRQWIFEYTLANCKVILGNIRVKLGMLPSAGRDIMLNGQDLINQGTKEIDDLKEGLRATLQATSKAVQIEQQNLVSDAVKNTLSNIPMPIIIA